VEVSAVRKQLQTRVTESRRAAKLRRETISQAQAAYDAFLAQIAVPTAKQLVSALKAEGFAWSVSTPSGMVRLSADTGRDDYIEIDFDGSGAEPKVIGRSSRGRGSRLVREEHALADGALPDTITDQDVIDYLLTALTPWLER
jgi:phosphoglycolate phosphatase-like HAD superfamily hydrolase